MPDRPEMIWRYSLALVLLVLFTAAVPAQPQQPAQTTAAPAKAAPAATDAKPTSADIKKRQQALDDPIASVNDRLTKAKQTPQNPAAELLQTELDTLKQISSTYDLQIAALERLQSLDAKNKHFEEEIARLSQPAPSDQHLSFMELDRTREELNAETSRKKTLDAKIDTADAGLQQAEQLVNQQQDRLTQMEAGSGNGSDPLAEIKRESARWNLESAKQTKILQQMELRNEKRAKEVHQTHLKFLKRQVRFLQTHARFSQAELQEQLQRIDKEKFDLNRDISRAKDQQITVKSRLDRMQKQLVAADPDEQKLIEARTEAFRLQYEALKTQIETGARRIELLDTGKTVWQQRYAVFNQSAEQAKLPQWRTQANNQIDQIDQDETSLRLWLGDWQSRLLTLNNKIDANQDTSAPVQRELTNQRQYMQQIVQAFTDLQTDFENSRRLENKLIDEINLRTSQRSWREWLDLTLHYEIYDNTLSDWSYAVTSALIVFVLLYFLRWLLISKLKHLDGSSQVSLASGFLSTVKRANSFFFLMIAVYVASQFLTLSPKTTLGIIKLTKVAFILQVAVWTSGFIRAWIFRTLAHRTKRDSASMGALNIFNFGSQVILWSIGLMLILQNLGIDVTALVAGLGISGVAVALALQRILNDLFSSLSIVLDKPFVLGDFVIFGEYMGAIEHIGIKTTRIRSLSGEQIICSNGDLLNTHIRNYKRMQERRVVFKLGVIYQTPPEKLRQIPVMIREIIEGQDSARFDRAHFASYGDFALLFEIVYYVLSPDYTIYMDTQQAINLAIYERFHAAGIEFAYPTQSLFLQTVAGSNTPPPAESQPPAAGTEKRSTPGYLTGSSR